MVRPTQLIILIITSFEYKVQTTAHMLKALYFRCDLDNQSYQSLKGEQSFEYKVQTTAHMLKALYFRCDLDNQSYQSLKGEQRTKYMKNHITGPTHHIKDNSHSPAITNPHPRKEIRFKSENSTTSLMSRTSCWRVQVKSIKSG